MGFLSFPELSAAASRGQQILNQLIGIGAAAAWSFGVTSIILLALKFTIGLRVSRADEETGLDLSQHGEGAYTA
jgi:Amt family ammonium transporter